MTCGKRADGRGVSPVIGIVLMVGIVVILATVVGVFAIDLGDNQKESMPVIRFGATYNDDPGAPNGEYLNVTVQGGERARTDTVELVVSDARDGSGSPTTLTGDPLASVGTEFLTRDTFSVNASSFGATTVDLSDATVRLVWDPDPDSGERGQTGTLWTWEDD